MSDKFNKTFDDSQARHEQLVESDPDAQGKKRFAEQQAARKAQEQQEVDRKNQAAVFSQQTQSKSANTELDNLAAEHLTPKETQRVSSAIAISKQQEAAAAPKEKNGAAKVPAKDPK